MLGIRTFVLGLSLTVSTISVINCSTSNTSTGSAGSTNAGGTWVGSIAADNNNNFGVRTLRLNLTQTHASGSCFAIGGSATITTTNGSDTYAGCWTGGSITSDSSSCPSDSSSSGTSTTSASIQSPYQAGALLGNQIEFQLTMGSNSVLTFSGTVDGKNMSGIFSSTLSTFDDGNDTTTENGNNPDDTGDDTNDTGDDTNDTGDNPSNPAPDGDTPRTSSLDLTAATITCPSVSGSFKVSK